MNNEQKIRLINLCVEAQKRCTVLCDENHIHNAINGCLSAADYKDLIISTLYEIIKKQNKIINKFEIDILNINFDIIE
jgi:ribosomal protein S12 methylthiotransferase accessory factor YcaO